MVDNDVRPPTKRELQHIIERAKLEENIGYIYELISILEETNDIEIADYIIEGLAQNPRLTSNLLFGLIPNYSSYAESLSCEAWTLGAVPLQDNEKFDVFLCYNNEDALLVNYIIKCLKKNKVTVLPIERIIFQGSLYVRDVSDVVDRVNSILVFIGKGIGPWRNDFFRELIVKFGQNKHSIIPVFLPSARDNLEMPVFFAGIEYLDFRKGGADYIKTILSAIDNKKFRT
jgi:hypothetical protein